MIALRSPAGDRTAVCIEERWAANTSAVPIVPIEAADIPDSIDVRQLLNEVKTLLASKLLIRVFIYSPEGTEEERQALSPLLGQVQMTLRDRVHLDPVFWHETQKIRPSDLDILVFLLWAHLFTVLPRPWSTFGMHAWMKVKMTAVSGMLIYYKEANRIGEVTASDRLQLVAQETASTNAAISQWLHRPGKELIEVGEASMAGNPPPDFTRDFRNYVEDFAKESLRQSRSSSKPQAGTWTQTLGVDEQPIFIPDRFRDKFMAYRIDSSRPYKPPPVTKAAILRRAHFSAFAPSAVAPGIECILEIWACSQSEHEYAEVVRRATKGKKVSHVGSKEGVPVEIGTWLTVSVSIPAFGIHSLKDRMFWDGSVANTSFAVKVPSDAGRGSYVGTAQIEAEAVPVATLHFQIAVATSLGEPGPLESQERAINSIFASYASEDRADVLQWARGAEAVGVNVFIDVTNLRAGANWELELFRRVPSADLFSLFWSEPASQSRWVEMEWRCALAARGLDCIYPVALVDPRSVPRHAS